MKILLIGNYPLDNQYSMLKYADMIFNNLSKSGHDVKLLQPPIILNLFPWPQKVKKWIGFIDKFIIFKFILYRKKKWADIIHILDHSNSIYITKNNNKPFLTTCHDLIGIRKNKDYPKISNSSYFNKFFQSKVSKGLTRSKYIICVSIATMNDCHNILKIKKNKMKVIYNSLNFHYKPLKKNMTNSILKKLKIDRNKEYFMHVGSNEWYKNKIGLLKIFLNLVKKFKLDVNLILVSSSAFLGTTSKLENDLRNFAIKNKIIDRLFILNNISNHEMSAIYSGSKGLIFPSIIEGAGLPVIEAQACGCPVFVSNRAPMTEYAGRAAIFFNPQRPSLAAKKIFKNLKNNIKLRNKGFKNILKFSKFKSKLLYIEIYKNIIKNYNAEKK